MKILFYFFLATTCSLMLVIAKGELAAQSTPEVKLSKSARLSAKGTAEGEKLLQIKGHTLTEIIKALDPLTSFRIESRTLKKQKFDFEYRGDLSDKAALVSLLNQKLESEVGVIVSEAKEAPVIYELIYEGPDACDNNNEAVINSMQQTNSAWTARCFTLSQISEKIMEWNDILIKGSSTVRVPKVTLEKGIDFERLRAQLAIYHLAMNHDKEASAQRVVYVYR